MYRRKGSRIPFEEIKYRLIRPPSFTYATYNWQVFTCTQTLVNLKTGSVLYQIQNGKPKLISYASNRLPEVAKNYSITELELCGLSINIASFPHMLNRVDFDAIIDHLSLTHIIKSKARTSHH